MQSINFPIRVGIPGLSSRILDVLVVVGALVGGPVAIWLNAPIVAWIWLCVLVRVAPGWLDWIAAVVMSAHLATVGGWSWGIALFLASTTVALRNWVERQPGSWRWVSEVLFGGVWLAVSHFGRTEIDSRLSLFLWLVGVLGILFFREREGV